MANNLLSKIQIGGVLYDLKDAEARASLELLVAEAAKHMTFAEGDTLKTAADVKNYIDAQVGSISNFDVVVADALPTASADTMFKLYLVADAKAESGVYIEYITILSNEEYKWEAIGTTATDLADYVTEAEFNGMLGSYPKFEELGALAFKGEATGTVAGETISGIKATGTGVTGVTLSDNAVEKDISSTGKFTPAGNVAGTVTIAEHAVPVTVINNDAQAVVATGTGVSNANVTVTPSKTQVVSNVTPGTLPSFTPGAFDGGKLETEDVTIAAHNNLTAAVSDETLTFTSAMIDAITFKAVTNYVAPTKAADTFDAGSTCSIETTNVVSGIDSATTTIEYEKVTGVTYKKAEENAAGTCAGSTVAIDATFTGAESAIKVDGKYTDTNYTAQANTGAIELAVGDIAIAAKDVTVQ